MSDPKTPGKPGYGAKILHEALASPPAGTVRVGDIRPVVKRLRELMRVHEAGSAHSPIPSEKLSPETEECLRRTTEIVHRAAMLGSGELRHVLEQMARGAETAPEANPHADEKEGGTSGGGQVKKGERVRFREILPRIRGYASELDEWERGVPVRDEEPPSPMPPYLLPSRRATRMVFDPKTGQSVPQDMLPAPSSSNDITPKSDIFRRYKWQLGSESLKRLARDLLDKDKRLTDSDKEAILDAVSSRQDEIGQNGKTLGDVVREEVERYLANKGNAPKTTLQIDAEAGVRILKEFCSDMALLDRMEKEGWLSPFLDESESAGKNRWLPVFKPVQIYWHSEAEVLESVRVIPESRLDDSISGGMTVRELLNEVTRSSVFESVRSAAAEKLK